MTNNGELVQELEQRLKEYLGVKHLFFCSNGTVALQMALKCIDKIGEIITTPFSYVATTNAILWEGFTPVYVDINPADCCIDVSKIEQAINEHTVAILVTHVYGNPCDVNSIEILANKYSLKVIYDGAHAFGCNYKGSSLLSYGDISTCSFHATKLFHTVEGGCVITDDDEIAGKLKLFRQFGHVQDDYFTMGINGKNSEFHAAMGLCMLDELENLIEERKKLSGYYLDNLSGTGLVRPITQSEIIEYNYVYFPVLLNSENDLLHLMIKLAENEIHARRYFYPSLNTLAFTNGTSCPVSEDIARRVLCLPFYNGMGVSAINHITKLIWKYVPCLSAEPLKRIQSGH